MQIDLNRMYDIRNKLNTYLDFTEEDKKPHWGQKGSSPRNLPPIHGQTLGCCGHKKCDIPREKCISHNVQNQMKKYGYAHDKLDSKGNTILGRNSLKNREDGKKSESGEKHEYKKKKAEDEEKNEEKITEDKIIEETADKATDKIIEEEEDKKTTPETKTKSDETPKKKSTVEKAKDILHGAGENVKKTISGIGGRFKGLFGKKNLSKNEYYDLSEYYDLVDRIDATIKK